MSDKLFQQAVRDWLEDGSDRTPRPAINAVLLAVKTTPQERDFRIPWRPRTMFDRLAVAAAVAVLAIGSFTIGSTLLFKPSQPAAGACPTPFSEADAIDTSGPGLSQAQRAWGIEGGTPSRVRPGLIAAFDPVFAFDPDPPAGAQLSVITIDPATGTRCRLATFSGEKPILEHLSQLDWSPSGDALAIALFSLGHEGDAIGETGEVWIWTASRLVRVWSGPGEQPGVEWAPDGRSIAVWMAVGDSSTVQMIFADGSPTREFNIRPYELKWSPDGTRWMVREFADVASGARPHYSVVEVSDGRMTPIDPGIASYKLVGWIDDEHVLLQILSADSGRDFVDVPLAAPDQHSTLPLPKSAGDSFVALAPDGHHIAYVTPGGRDRDGDGGGGGLEIADLAAAGSSPIHLVTGGLFSPGIAWAPDGSQVVFTRYVAESCCSATTWIVNADGTNLRAIATGNTWTMDDPWQPVPVR